MGDAALNVHLDDQVGQLTVTAAPTGEDLLREVMNTVGKKGRLGGQIRCVVGVSMLPISCDFTLNCGPTSSPFARLQQTIATHGLAARARALLDPPPDATALRRAVVASVVLATTKLSITQLHHSVELSLLPPDTRTSQRWHCADVELHSSGQVR